jgi:steroid delta-isomerase-like uncharacterized protein
MTARENKTIIQHYFDAQNSHDLNAIFAYFSRDIVSHSVPGAPDPQDINVIKGYFTAMHDAIPDLHTTLHDSVAEGDRVAVRFSVTGTLAKDFMGDPAGQLVNWYIFTIYRLHDGKIAEVWSH